MIKLLKKKIEDKNITIGVVGIGYVGLPLSILFSKKGYKVFCFDTDKKKVKKINQKKSYLNRISDKEVSLILKNKGMAFATFSKIAFCDFIILCVPTPLKKNKYPDTSFIQKTIENIKKYLHESQCIVLESTSYPGTTKDHIYKKIKDQFKIGENFFIGFSPERINPGENENSIFNIPKVVSGHTKNCLSIISTFYSKFFKRVIKSDSTDKAEFSKLIENIYRSVNISFINEMKFIADKMNMDIFDIIRLSKTKPYGFTAFLPGPGIGGHCIPVDPMFLYWKAKRLKINANFIKLSAETNSMVINFLIKKIKAELKKININIKKSKILILGVAYKKNIDDLRESASIKLINYFIKKNLIKNIDWYDPEIKGYLKTRSVKFNKKQILLKSENLKSYDIVVLMTDHDIFDYKMIYKFSKKIIDCRGRYQIDNKVIRG